MKKIFKSRIFLVIICGIIFTSIGVFADNLLASNVTYKNTTVDAAINDLYNSVSKYATTTDWVILRKNGDTTSIRLKAKENHYNYYRVVEIAKGDNTTCNVYATNHYEYLHDIVLNQDYSTKNPNATNEYRVYIEANGGFCSYQVIYHN